MKCVNCGGEVESQAIRCPYCSSRNEAGISFHKEVYAKIQRNRLLAPLLLRQQTPELVQRLLTRIILAMGILGIIFIGISLGMILLMEELADSGRMPVRGSYAAEYAEIMDVYDNAPYGRWKMYLNEFMDAWDSGKAIQTYHIEQVIYYGFNVYYDTDMDAQLQEQAKREVDALLEGILQLNEEELVLFHKADEQYTYLRVPDSQAQQQLISLIEAKLATRLEEE